MKGEDTTLKGVSTCQNRSSSFAHIVKAWVFVPHMGNLWGRRRVSPIDAYRLLKGERSSCHQEASSEARCIPC